MGIYKVQPNSKAPQGLSVGDQVVTGGGTYMITGVNGDGSYSSVMYNAGQNTANYTGKYDTVPTASANGYNSGAGTGSSNSQYIGSGGSGGSSGSSSGSSSDSAIGTESYYLKLLSDTLGSSYTPTVSSADASAAAAKTISFAEAVELAGQVLEPQYAAAYQDAAANAAQRLEKAGLYDTLYGQSLAADAEMNVSQDLNAAIYSLALDLSQASESNAQKILSLAADESQFAAEMDAKQRATVLSYMLKLMEAQS